MPTVPTVPPGPRSSGEGTARPERPERPEPGGTGRRRPRLLPHPRWRGRGGRKRSPARASHPPAARRVPERAEPGMLPAMPRHKGASSTRAARGTRPSACPELARKKERKKEEEAFLK